MDRIAQQALDSWNREVGAEMARLIERGVPPFDASKRATDVVARRRAERSAAEDEVRFRSTLANFDRA